MNRRQRDMKGVFNRFPGQRVLVQQCPRQVRHHLVQFQPRQAGEKPDPAFRCFHVTFAGFINHQLRNMAIEIAPSGLPPLTRDLLTRHADQITARPRREIAHDSGLQVQFPLICGHLFPSTSGIGSAFHPWRFVLHTPYLSTLRSSPFARRTCVFATIAALCDMVGQAQRHDTHHPCHRPQTTNTKANSQKSSILSPDPTNPARSPQPNTAAKGSPTSARPVFGNESRQLLFLFACYASVSCQVLYERRDLIQVLYAH